MVDKIILAGEPEELRTAITTIMAVHQMLEDLDVGSGGNNYRDFHPRRAKRPIVTLHFKESPSAERTQQLRTGEISFRIMTRTTSTITKDELKAMGKLIETKFATPPYVWNKGKNLYSYTHWEEGYQFQILAPNSQTAKALVEQTLDLRGKTPDWENFASVLCNSPEAKYPTLGEREVILGESVRLPARRPNVEVRFRRATLWLSGVPKPIVLLDLKNKGNPIVTM